MPSGFNSDGLNGQRVHPALPLLQRAHEFVAHTREHRGNSSRQDTTLPGPLPSRSPQLLTTSQVVPSQGLIARDTPMELGDESNTDTTGLGDSKYASLAGFSQLA